MDKIDLSPKKEKKRINWSAIWGSTRVVLGILTLIVAIPTGLYVALWVCLVGGIVEIVEALKATPVNSMGIAVGILRVMLTGISGWLSVFLLLAVAKAIGGNVRTSYRSRRF